MIETKASEQNYIMPHRELLIEILTSASLAPSPENNQPWKFEIKEDSVVLNYVKDLALLTDRKHKLNLISLGACLENLAIRAEFENLSVVINFNVLLSGHLNGVLPEQIAEIKFISSHLNSDSPAQQKGVLFPFLKRRHTNRALYSKRAISGSSTQALQNCIDKRAHLVLLESTSDIKIFAQGIANMDQLRFENKLFHHEVTKSIRFSDKEIQSTKTGIAVKSLSLPWGGEIFLKMISNWSFFKMLIPLGIGKVFSMTAKKQVINSGAIAILFSRDQSAQGLIQAGMNFQRLWIVAEKEGLDAQPIGHWSVFGDLDSELIGNDVNSRELDKFRAVTNDLAKRLNLPSENTPAMILRLGYARKKNRNPSLRLHIKDLVQGLENIRSKDAAASETR